ncbi:MAG TPA: ribonuclease [Azospira sp.]|nr:ribonuclease [Azospira sp.]
MNARLLVLLRLFTALVLAACLGSAAARGVNNAHDANAPLDTVALAALPPEARQTLQLIKQGGPFPYPRKDGSTFGNFEKRLPLQPRGYYREYTVPTPGSRDRGARRIVAGGKPQTSGEYYYTADHYRSFRRIRE